MALPPEAAAFKCPGSYPERKLGIWIRSMHDVLAVHAGEGFQVRVGCEPPLPQEQLEPMGRSHAPTVGAVGSIHGNCFPAPRFRHPRHQSEEYRHQRTGRRRRRDCRAPQIAKKPTPALGLENYVEKKQISKM
jgi:hypothetical protein